MAADDISIPTSSFQRRKRRKYKPAAICKYPSCDGYAWAQGYCDPHYQKLKREGVLHKKRIMKDHLARFHSKWRGNEDTGCWDWIGTVHPNGYGMFGVWEEGKTYRASRYAYEKLVGTIPDGLMVLHKCDRRVCVNPAHLFLGTAKDNSDDCVRKGRHGMRLGVLNKKLSEKMVMNLRVMYARGDHSMLELAKIYGIQESHVHGIVKGKSRLAG